MPGRSQYPTGENLESFLLQAGFSATFVAGFDLELWALAGWRAFEREADRVMLAAAGTREYDPAQVSPRGVLDLGADLVSVTSAAYGSTTFVQGTDFRLFPLNAARLGRPYNAVTFGYWRRFWSSTFPLSTLIAIVGSWGFGTLIPEDAWIGMLAMAGREMQPLLGQASSKGLEMFTEADVTERYGPKPLEALLTGWSLTALGTCGGLGVDGKRHYGRYTRVPQPV